MTPSPTAGRYDRRLGCGRLLLVLLFAPLLVAGCTASGGSGSAQSTSSSTSSAIGFVTQSTTSCADVAAGHAKVLSELTYTVANGVITRVNPRFFSYWVKVQPASARGTLVVTETASKRSALFLVATGSGVYTGAGASATACAPVTSTVLQNPGQTGRPVSVTFNATNAGSGLLVAVTFASDSVLGEAQPTPSPVTYRISTTGVSGSAATIKLVA